LKKIKIKKLKISIITVSRNSQETIRDTIESVLGQTYQDVEYIIIDGNSNDNTMSIINEYSDRCAHIIHEVDLGIYDAMNKGIALCTGDIIGILNSDDIFNKSNTLSEIHEEFIKSNAESIYGDLVYVSVQDTNEVVRVWKAGKYNNMSFKYGWMPPHPTFFVKKGNYANYGNFRAGFKISADYELMLRLLYKYKISTSYLPIVLTRMRIGGISNLSLKNRLKAQNEDKLAWTINGLTPGYFTILLKPLRKVAQFFYKLYKK